MSLSSLWRRGVMGGRSVVVVVGGGDRGQIFTPSDGVAGGWAGGGRKGTRRGRSRSIHRIDSQVQAGGAHPSNSGSRVTLTSNSAESSSLKKPAEAAATESTPHIQVEKRARASMPARYRDCQGRVWRGGL